MSYDPDDDVVQRCRRGGPIKGQSLGQISGGPSIGEVTDRLSLANEEVVDPYSSYGKFVPAPFGAN